MRKWQLITAATVGIMASGSGFIQAQAADFFFSVDFSTKTVDNFDDFTQTFLETTYNLGNKINFSARFQYKYNVCQDQQPDVNMSFRHGYRLNGNAPTISGSIQELPDLECNEDFTLYQISVFDEINSEDLSYLVNDDDNFLRFYPLLRFKALDISPLPVITVRNIQFTYTVEYDFNTTYLFNYFLSDTDYSSYGRTAGVTGSTTAANYFEYVMTTAGNDRFFIINSVVTDFGSGRNKFAVDYNMQYFRGESIGARYSTTLIGDQTVNISASVDQQMQIAYDYFYLNAANNVQPIVDVPEFNFEYEDCGSFLALNVGCFINNGLAYITNDAPIISDAITLLNSGMQMAGQAFGVIGSFTEDNVFGVLVLGGLGLIAVRWFLKND
jgi:uncharacterized protein YciU (UPF0263 family)